MMKKLFFLFCALMLIGIGAWAQDDNGEDVVFTERMNTTDASLWTGQGTISSLDEDGIQAYAGDAQKFSKGNVLTQTIYGLPAGTYEVKFYAFAVIKSKKFGDISSKDCGTGIAQGYATAGNNTVTESLTIPDNYVSSISWEENDNVSTVTLTVELADGDVLEYGIQDANEGGQWYGIKAISLTHQGALTARELTNGQVVEDEVAVLEHWSITSNDDVELMYSNGKSLNDPSGMSTPNIDYWEDEALPIANISHYDIMGLPAGYYKVSVDARALNEDSEDAIAQNKIYFTAGGNDNKVDITSGTNTTYNESPEYYGTYDIICQLGGEEAEEEGTAYSLSGIGFTVVESSNVTRLSWKNLKVEYIGSELTYSIGEPQCSAQVAVKGGTVAIVYNDCIGALDTDVLKFDDSKTISVNNVAVTSDTIFTTSGTTATVTFTMPSFTDNEVTISVPEGLIYWSGMNLNEESQKTAGKEISPSGEFTLTTPPFETGSEYLIVNASDGYYFGGGLTWGTTVTELKKPQYIKLEQNEDGTYKLDAHQYLSDDEHYLGVDLHLDSKSVDWVIAKSDAGYTIYNASAGGYLTGNGLQQEVTGQTTPSAASYWNFLTYDDVVNSMEGASMTNQVDVTALIKAPELKRNSNNAYTDYTAPWTVTDEGSVTFGAGSSTANCAESNSSFEVRQTITLPKAGTYLLSAQAFYRGTTTNVPVLFAGEDTSEFLPLTSNISSIVDAYQAFLAGDYTVEAISIETENDEATVSIGFKCEDASLWNVMGELQLLYLGTAEEISWTMYDVGWGTLILPFDAKIPVDADGNDELTLYTGNSIFVSGSDILFGNPATSIQANTPYIVMSNNEYEEGDSTKYTFSGYPINEENSYSDGNLLVGTFKDMHYNGSQENDFAGDGTEYVLQYHTDEGLNFYPIISTSNNVTLTAYHCYMVIESSVQPTSLNIPAVLSAGRYNDDTTGIVAVERDAIVNEAIYDLSGRRVAKATKGVYIINGKKVLVK